MALQTRILIRVFGPCFLKDRRRKSLRVARRRPFGVNVLVAAAAQIRAFILARRCDLTGRLNHHPIGLWRDQYVRCRGGWHRVGQHDAETQANTERYHKGNHTTRE